MTQADYLVQAINDKHAIDTALGSYRVETATDLAAGRPMNTGRLIALTRPFYGHERWVRGCGHETAARETNAMLDRAAEQIINLMGDHLQQWVFAGDLSYEQYRTVLKQRTSVLVHEVGRVKEKLAAEGMGTNPAYCNGQEEVTA